MPPKGKHVVYFVRQLSGGAIKVGTSMNLSSRLASLQSEAGEISLIGYIDGGVEEEKRMHHRLRHARIKGEWFKPDEFVMREANISAAHMAEMVEIKNRNMVPIDQLEAAFSRLYG